MAHRRTLKLIRQCLLFSKLEEEVISAKLANKSIIIQIDANSKLGKSVIPKNPNGAVLADIPERNALIVATSLSTKCSGVMTRSRTTEGRVKESVIDFVITSADLLDALEDLIIDEKQEHILTKITHSKNTVKKVTSDHNVMLSKFSLTIKPPNKVDVLKFRNKGSQGKFKIATNNCPSLYLTQNKI